MNLSSGRTVVMALAAPSAVAPDLGAAVAGDQALPCWHLGAKAALARDSGFHGAGPMSPLSRLATEASGDVKLSPSYGYSSQW